MTANKLAHRSIGLRRKILDSLAEADDRVQDVGVHHQQLLNQERLERLEMEKKMVFKQIGLDSEQKRSQPGKGLHQVNSFPYKCSKNNKCSC